MLQLSTKFSHGTKMPPWSFSLELLEKLFLIYLSLNLTEFSYLETLLPSTLLALLYHGLLIKDPSIAQQGRLTHESCLCMGCKLSAY